MNTTNKTVLITGGGSGIGFQIAKLFSENGSKVIITGRSEARLKEAAAKLSNVDYFAADVTKADDTEKLVNHINANYPVLDVLINNAGNASAYNLGENAGAYEKAEAEIVTNYLSIVRLTEELLPLLSKQAEAAIVNVTSILSLAPAFTIPTYSASKAALRSYTQILRFTLEKKGSAIKVFELLPPLVNTEFSKEIGGENGIAPEVVAQDLLNAFETETYDVHVGQTAGFYQAFFSASGPAVATLNQGRG
jgi:uncharacterized oxidoreductase